MSENTIDNLFERFDFENNTYTIGDKTYNVKEVSAGEFEQIQDMMADIKDDDGSNPKEIIKKDREFTKLLLKAVLDLDYDNVKNEISIVDLRTMVGELGGFLVNFGSMKGLNDYITSLKAKLKKSPQNNTKN